MKKNKSFVQPANNLEIVSRLYKALQEFAIGGTVTMNGSYEQAMNDTRNMAGLANIDAMQSSRFKDMQKMIQGVEMVTAMAGQLSSATGGSMGDTSGTMTGETRQPVSTVNTMTAKGSTVPGFAFGGDILQETPKPKTKYIPATKRDSMNVQKQYLNRQKQLQKLGYTKEYDSVGDFGLAHQEMYKDFETMQKREKAGKTTQVIMNGMRNPMVYQAGVYRDDNVEGNPFLYKTQESTDIGVINPEVPYSLFDTRIVPTKKERWLNKDTGDGVINYGYDFGENYNPTPAKKGRTTPVNKNIIIKKQPIKNIPYTRPIDKMAFGGTANIPVEVEGQEVGETPNGELLEFKGPSHEQGGIPISLPESTKIYSKRIEKFGETMAERKKIREKKLTNLNKLLETSKGDIAVKNAHKRSTEALNEQEKADLQTQEMFKAISTLQEFAGGTDENGIRKSNNYIEKNPFDLEQLSMLLNNEYGGFNNKNHLGTPRDNVKDMSFSTDIDGVEKYSPSHDNLDAIDYNDINDSSENNDKGLPGTWVGRRIRANGDTETPAIGDIMSLVGDAYSASAPMNNTLENRAGDTPNINAFKDYGKKGLDTLDKTKNYINQTRDEKLKDLELSRTGSIKRNQNSARSVNTVRALNLATDAGVNNQKDEMYNTFAQQMMSILGQQSGMENQQDQIVMSGEQERDLNDRKDRDNFYTQLGKDKSTKGEGIQRIGKDLNAMKQNEMATNLINNLSKYGLQVNQKGEITYQGKTREEMSSDEKLEADMIAKGFEKDANGNWIKSKKV